MTLVILRALSIWIDKASKNTPTVGDGQLKRRGCRSLVVTRRVVCEPSQNRRNATVNSGSHQKCHAILDPGMTVANIRDDCIANNGNGQSAKHHATTKLKAIRQKGDTHWDES
jgi:hypothetical protein